MRVLEKLLKNRFWWIGLLLLFIAVIYIASLANFRIDLTSERRFSLSNSTKKVLRHLDQPVRIDIYLAGDLSSGFKKLSVASDELLNEFKEYAKGNLQYAFIKPGEGLPDSLRYQV